MQSEAVEPSLSSAQQSLAHLPTQEDLPARGGRGEQDGLAEETAHLGRLDRFNSALSRVMFVEPDVPGAVQARPCEMRLSAFVASRISVSTDPELHALAHTIEQRVLPCLSGQAVIEIAHAVEMRAPWMFEHLPTLAAHRQRLNRAAEMAAAFSPDHLGKLSQALRKEAARS